MYTELNLTLTFVLLASGLLACARLGRMYVFVFSVGCILVSNITVVKEVQVFGLSTSLGVIIYSLVYLATDICSEYGDKRDAYRLAVANLVAQLVFLVYIQLSVAVPATTANAPAAEAIRTLFSTTPRITIAAILAAIGAFVDIAIYEQLMRRWRKGPIGLLVRNNVSTILGQTVNTAMFFVVAFYGVLDNLGQIILTALAIKVLIAIFDSPFLVLAAWILPKEWQDNESWTYHESTNVGG